MSYRLAPEPHYVSPETAASVLRVNVHSVYRALRRNEIPHFKDAGVYRIPVQFFGITPEPVMLPVKGGHIGQLELDLEW